MPQVDKHAPGDFCWIELASTDHNAAKNFYQSLLAWVPDDMPMGESGVYTIFRMNGRDCAAGYTMGPDERAQNVPPHWNLYVAVENADAAAAKAEALGGKVLAGPFDVMDAGRMAVIQDPTGAVVAIWQAKRNAGLGVVGEPGTFCWADLSTPDPAAAQKFYEGLFGWKLTRGEKDPSGYLHIMNGENFIGGVPPTQHRDPHAPPHWLIYFAVADVDASAAQAKKLGARFYVEPMSIEGVGRMAVMSDPQGAVSAIFKESPRS